MVQMRKNLIVDDEKVKTLARLRGTSESEAVRQAVDHALMAEEVMAAVRELHARGGIDDVFCTLPDGTDTSTGVVEAEGPAAGAVQRTSS